MTMFEGTMIFESCFGRFFMLLSNHSLTPIQKGDRMRSRTGLILAFSCFIVFAGCATTQSASTPSNFSIPSNFIGVWKFAGVRIQQSQTIIPGTNFSLPLISGGTCIQRLGGILDIHPDGTFSYREASTRKCPIPPGTINPFPQQKLDRMSKPVFQSGKGKLANSPKGDWQLLYQTPKALIPMAKVKIISGSHCPILRVSGIAFPFEDIAFQSTKDHLSNRDLIKLASFPSP